jgi:hypothetical protein
MRRTKKDEVERVRVIAERAVTKVEPSCRSRMLAYQKVAAVIGVSASWLRKFVTVEGTPEPRFSVGVALIRYYDEVCSGLDAETIAEQKLTAKIIGEMHEAYTFTGTPAAPAISATSISTDPVDHNA